MTLMKATALDDVYVITHARKVRRATYQETFVVASVTIITRTSSVSCVYDKFAVRRHFGDLA